MPMDESVSSSLSPGLASALSPEAARTLAEKGIVAVDLDTEGASESALVIRHSGRCSVYRNICPHAGRRLDYAPGRFLIDGENLVCAAHGASFRLSDGLCVSGPCRGQSLSPWPQPGDAGGALQEP